MNVYEFIRISTKFAHDTQVWRDITHRTSEDLRCYIHGVEVALYTTAQYTGLTYEQIGAIVEALEDQLDV